MIQNQKFKKSTITGSVAALAIAGLLMHAPHGQAQSATDPTQQAKIQIGLKLSPVPLNMGSRDPNLVGYGSFLVNSVAICNDCHSAGPPTEYAAGGTPYFGQHPTVVNPSVFLGGGNDFGAFPDPTGPFPHVVSRNLTPDSSGLPIGGVTYDQFVQIIRTGVDMDHVHPTCTGAPDGKCIPAPFNGDLLQVMPWPLFANMPDSDLQAIYAYLSSVPCVEGGPGEPAHRCGPSRTPKTMAIAGPKNTTVTQNGILLDGAKSTSADGKPLTYFWSIPQGSPSTAISGGTTATPTVTFPSTRGLYLFQLTVTDASGKSSTDKASVYYEGQ